MNEFVNLSLWFGKKHCFSVSIDFDEPGCCGVGICVLVIWFVFNAISFRISILFAELSSCEVAAENYRKKIKQNLNHFFFKIWDFYECRQFFNREWHSHQFTACKIYMHLFSLRCRKPILIPITRFYVTKNWTIRKKIIFDILSTQDGCWVYASCCLLYTSDAADD